MLANSAAAVAIWSILAFGMGPQQSSPSLQPRSSSNQPDEHPTTVLLNHATSVLPEDASGLYRFGDPGTAIGEGVQIDEQFGEVTGYLTIKNAGGGKPAIASFFLSHIEGGGGTLNFTTKAVHGVSYAFTGKLVRGPGLSRAQDGFYLLQGELIMHGEKQAGPPRSISLKLTGQH